MSATASALALELRDVHAWFETPQGVVRAVEGVSLAVQQGDRLGVVGESGSGKTQSFLSALALSVGYPGVVRGEAWVAGENVLADLPSAARDVRDSRGDVTRIEVAERWRRTHRRRAARALDGSVGMLTQDPKRSLVPYWSVERHLTEILSRAAARAAARDRAKELLASLGFTALDRVLGAFPSELSGGEAQRVMLALIMASQPRLLIADEPTTALDALNQQRVLTEIDVLHSRQRIGLILISHDIGLVAEHTTSVAVIYGGRVVERAPARVLLAGGDEVFHPYTRELQDGHRRRSLGLPIAPRLGSEAAVRSPRGCPFAARCELRPRLREEVRVRCDTEVPAERELKPRHSVACFGAVE